MRDTLQGRTLPETEATPPGARRNETTLTTTNSEKVAGEWSPPETIGKYEIRGELGRGACGIVYRGFDPFVQRDVAVKVALPEDKQKSAPENLATPDRHAFFVEARAAGMLQHPHIVSLFDAGVTGDLNYIVMEYIDGRTLRDFTRNSMDRLPVDQAVDVVFKCSKALDYAHGKGVLHRDIKPSNIMLSRDGVPKIMDFSVAEVTRNLTGSTALVGSPLYMSPEQVRRESPGPQSDLYALGTLLFELLAGEPPFYSSDVSELFRKIERTPAPLLSDKRPDLPKGLVDIVERLLRKDPRQRFETGRELASALTRVFESLRNTGEKITRRENQDALRALSFFNDFSESEIDEILGVSSMVSFRKDEVIIEEGDIDNTFYIIVLGSVDVRKGSHTLQSLGKGDCFGEIGFLLKTKRTATIVANSPVVLLKVNATQMQQVSQECQLRYYKVFTETLIYRLSMTSAKLAALGGQRPPS